ncbi:MAG TPA: ABC transporter substrate-binding protein [Flavobacteriaceae bacterium]|nr:ABC transporter substrate-binding protein [Flavobacteriaceae bacterium]HPF11299.1 ABC transporter substrate-binding protein [Flavobacteriaceae bacterium]HQU22209.1 ABC transporter substrate-binding protein [Flavobacteriaceae bacterium]HQU64482.1 ABC transporter substrate-binding protein [Flavobacteriaceae bacterium]HRW44613.1 ABC transporter substrate-binding protein [Flavobacteriaceae bacterium]
MACASRTIKILSLWIFLGCVPLGLISCGNNTQQDRDFKVFRYNEHSNITSLDPAFARNPQNIWPTNQLFNGLIQLDDSLQIRPDIAYHWEIIDSTQTYRFFLRKDVYFHKNKVFGKDSTRTVTAYDFEYSLNRLIDPEVASPGSWVLQNVDRFYAENDSVFTLQLKQPFPAFLGLLSMRYCSVVPKEAIDFYGNNFRSHPVGTGPFQFKLWEENVKLVFRKNSLYFETDDQGVRLPYLEAVAITFLPDKQSEFLQFAQGKIDFLSSLDHSYKDEILTSRGQLQPKYQDWAYMITSPNLNTEYLGFFMETSTPEIRSKSLRKAINYGFDREKMITYLRNGMGIPAIHGFIPKGLPGFASIEGYTYQPEKAKALVEAYKVETGDANPEIVIGTNSQYLDICEYIQRELEKIGISVTIDVMPPSTLRQMKSSGKLDIFRASWIADYPDAENYLSLFYSPNFVPHGPNYMHYKNDGLDSLYREALSVNNINERKKLYTKMDSLIMEDAPVVPLYYDMAIRFVNKNVYGLGINPQNFLFLKKVQKKR